MNLFYFDQSFWDYLPQGEIQHDFISTKIIGMEETPSDFMERVHYEIKEKFGENEEELKSRPRFYELQKGDRIIFLAGQALRILTIL